MIIDFIVKYWLEFVFGLVTLAITTGVKHYFNLERKAYRDKWDAREKEMREEIISKLEEEISEVEKASKEADEHIQAEIKDINKKVKGLNGGILSIQGKQFITECKALLEPNHIITSDEYEEFEMDYSAYKGLGGNHRGDALHDRVIEKFDKQL